MSVGEVPMSDAELRDAECTSADWRHHRGLTIRREYAHFDGLALRVDQGAPEELKARAWQASIDCLKKWGGCKTAFDMHHEGARIYEQDRARIRADWPQIVLSNPACKPYWKQFQEK
jgi:hypothetical protein